MTGHQIAHGGPRALVCRVHDVETRGMLQLLHRKLMHGPHAWRGIGVLSGILLEHLHGLGQVPRRKTLIRKQHHDIVSHHANRLEVLYRVIRHGGIQRAIDAMGVGGAHQ
ncbi:hypothetical protein D3C85_1098620 [compost metagenome]